MKIASTKLGFCQSIGFFGLATGVVALLLNTQFALGQGGNLDSSEEAKPFSDLRRLSEVPVLSPRPGKFDSAGAFNPTAVRTSDGKIVMLYRGQDAKGVSRVGFAKSDDGIHFKQDDEPVLQPSESDEKNGVEDPRLSPDLAEAGQWWLTATAYDQDAQLALYKSADLRHWKRVDIIMPAFKGAWNIHWT